MIDGIYLVVVIAAFGLATCSRTPWKGCRPMFEIVVGIVGILLIGYLLVSVVRPEKF